MFHSLFMLILYVIIAMQLGCLCRDSTVVVHYLMVLISCEALDWMNEWTITYVWSVTWFNLVFFPGVHKRMIGLGFCFDFCFCLFGFWFGLGFLPPNIPVSFWVSAVEQLCEGAPSLRDKESEGMPNSADRHLRLHLQWPSLLESRGKKACWAGLCDHWEGIGKVSQNCLSQSEDKAMLDYARGGPFSENLVCSLRRQRVEEITNYTSWLPLLGCAGSVVGGALLWVICNVFVSTAVLVQLGSGELWQWRRGISWAELWADAKLHS